MTLTPQVPAEGISKRQLQLDDAESFHIECECTCEDHAVEAWIEIHRDEIMADWELASEGNEIYKIDPLK